MSNDFTKYIGEKYTNEYKEICQDCFVLNVYHYKENGGKYVVSVAKVTKGHREGESFGWERGMLFGEGNFSFRVAVGRKSQKKIDNIKQVIADNLDEIFNTWMAGEYQALVNKVCSLVS